MLRTNKRHRSAFAEESETEEQKEKRRRRFAPVVGLLYGEGVAARKLRLRRLGFSPLLYTTKASLDDLPVNQQPAM